MKHETIKKIVELEYQAKLLKRMREIENILLNSGAYSNHNMELQNLNFEKLNVPKWEIDIINNGKSVKTIFAHKLLKEYDIVIKEIKKEMEN